MQNNAKRKEPMCYIGKDGFVFLVMGFMRQRDHVLKQQARLIAGLVINGNPS